MYIEISSRLTGKTTRLIEKIVFDFTIKSEGIVENKNFDLLHISCDKVKDDTKDFSAISIIDLPSFNSSIGQEYYTIDQLIIILHKKLGVGGKHEQNLLL